MKLLIIEGSIAINKQLITKLDFSKRFIIIEFI